MVAVGPLATGPECLVLSQAEYAVRGEQKSWQAPAFRAISSICGGSHVRELKKSPWSKECFEQEQKKSGPGDCAVAPCNTRASGSQGRRFCSRNWRHRSRRPVACILLLLWLEEVQCKVCQVCLPGYRYPFGLKRAATYISGTYWNATGPCLVEAAMSFESFGSCRKLPLALHPSHTTRMHSAPAAHVRIP